MPPNKDSFKEYVLDQLNLLHGVVAKPMFGGFGLYQEGEMFGIVYKEQLYFKINENNYRDFGERDMPTFKPNEKQELKSYQQVPEDVLENQEELRLWAWKALGSDSK